MKKKKKKENSKDKTTFITWIAGIHINLHYYRICEFLDIIFIIPDSPKCASSLSTISLLFSYRKQYKVTAAWSHTVPYYNTAEKYKYKDKNLWYLSFLRPAISESLRPSSICTFSRAPCILLWEANTFSNMIVTLQLSSLASASCRWKFPT